MASACCWWSRTSCKPKAPCTRSSWVDGSCGSPRSATQMPFRSSTLIRPRVLGILHKHRCPQCDINRDINPGERRRPSVDNAEPRRLNIPDPAYAPGRWRTPRIESRMRYPSTPRLLVVGVFILPGILDTLCGYSIQTKIRFAATQQSVLAG